MNTYNSKEFDDTLNNKPCYSSTPTLKDLAPALSSTPTYTMVLKKLQPPLPQQVGGSRNYEHNDM